MGMPVAASSGGLFAYLADNNFDSEPLKSCSPFIEMAVEARATLS